VLFSPNSKGGNNEMSKAKSINIIAETLMKEIFVIRTS
jgi:hypothetical protein